MEVGENRVHVFYDAEKRTKTRDIQEASASAAVSMY
jgi:hypothetical protein